MPTRLALPVSEHTDDHGLQTFVVDHSFEEVLNRIAPIQAPTSSEESRGGCIYRLLDGRRVFITPQSVAWFEEDPELHEGEM